MRSVLARTLTSAVRVEGLRSESIFCDRNPSTARRIWKICSISARYRQARHKTNTKKAPDKRSFGKISGISFVWGRLLTIKQKEKKKNKQKKQFFQTQGPQCQRAVDRRIQKSKGFIIDTHKIHVFTGLLLLLTRSEITEIRVGASRWALPSAK